MKMNEENMKRFETMIREFAVDNNLKVEIEHDWSKVQTCLRFKILECRSQRDCLVDWTSKKSLSQAGALIFSYITREFNLDDYNRPLDLKIENVIFNNPATIVLWEDGTKTVVKCQDGDEYSKETGLAVCIAKKALGNKGNFNEVFKKWIPDYDTTTVTTTTSAIEGESYTIDMGGAKKYDKAFINAVAEGVADCFRTRKRLRDLL